MHTFIVNPKSAAGRTQKMWSAIEGKLKDKFDSNYRIIYTDHMQHATEIAREQLQEGVETIIAVGGDGTVNEVVNGFFENDQLINPNAALGIICSGTGADFIRTMGWDKDIDKALQRIEKRQTQIIDLGKATFTDHNGNRQQRYFINITDFGISGMIVERLSTAKWFGGRLDFAYGIISSLLIYKNSEIEFQLDDGPWQNVTANNFIVGNGKYFGGGLKPTPDAQVDDGLLDVMIFGDLTVLEGIANMPNLRRGEHTSHPKATFDRATHIRAKSRERVLIDMDGEFIGQLPIEIQIVPQAISICS